MDTNQNDLGLGGNLPPGFKPAAPGAELRELERLAAEMNAFAAKQKEDPSLVKPAPRTPTVPAAVAPVATTPAGSLPGAPEFSSPADVSGATMITSDPVMEAQLPQPTPPALHPTRAPELPTPPVASKPPPSRIVLTGRTGVGKSFIASRIDGAKILELDTWIREQIVRILGNIAEGPAADNLVRIILEWGNGQVNEKYPLTPARLLFVQWVQVNGLSDFGKPGFWVRRLIAQADEWQSNYNAQIIVTAVESSEDFKALVNAGFTHYHVVCGAPTYATRPKRAGANNSLAAFLDQDVTKKLSQQPRGEKLRCIWSDTTAAPQRLFTAAQWIQQMAIVNTIPETGE